MPEAILSIDTATEAISVALLLEGATFEALETEKNKHSECVIPMVDALLKRGGITARDLTAIAFGAGPGAFTGLRVACGVAQGLAWALDLPVLPINNLKAAAVQKKDYTGRMLVALDARMNEAYVGAFEMREGKVLGELLAPTLLKPEAIASYAESLAIDFMAGSALAVYREKIRLNDRCLFDATLAATAASIGRLGREDLHNGKAVTAAQASPLYIRNRVALTIEERKAGERL